MAMSINQKYKILWGVLILVAGLNVWLLYGKINLQQSLNRLQSQKIQKAELSMISEAVRFTDTGSFLGKPLQLVALFTDYGCTRCAVSEIGYLNKWHKQYQNMLKVYYLGSSKKYLKDLGAEFSYRTIDSANHLFSVAVPTGNPIAIVDEYGMVHAIHTNDLTRPGSDRRRAHFYERVRSLFSAVYEK